MSELERLSMDDLEGQSATALPTKEVMSLLDLNADIDLALDLAAPVDLAVAPTSTSPLPSLRRPRPTSCPSARTLRR